MQAFIRSAHLKKLRFFAVGHLPLANHASIIRSAHLKKLRFFRCRAVALSAEK